MSENTMCEAFEAWHTSLIEECIKNRNFDELHMIGINKFRYSQAWQAAIAHQNQEAVDAILVSDMSPTYCNDMGRILGGFNHDIKKVFLAPPQPQEVADALEEAAKICDSKVVYKDLYHDLNVHNEMLEDCAKEIRALIK